MVELDKKLDNILAGVWLGFGVLQLIIAVALAKQPRSWLLRIAIIIAVLSASIVIGPPLLAPFVL